MEQHGRGDSLVKENDVKRPKRSYGNDLSTSCRRLSTQLIRRGYVHARQIFILSNYSRPDNIMGTPKINHLTFKSIMQ